MQSAIKFFKKVKKWVNETGGEKLSEELKNPKYKEKITETNPEYRRVRILFYVQRFPETISIKNLTHLLFPSIKENSKEFKRKKEIIKKDLQILTKMKILMRLKKGTYVIHPRWKKYIFFDTPIPVKEPPASEEVIYDMKFPIKYRVPEIIDFLWIVNLDALINSTKGIRKSYLKNLKTFKNSEEIRKFAWYILFLKPNKFLKEFRDLFEFVKIIQNKLSEKGYLTINEYNEIIRKCPILLEIRSLISFYPKINNFSKKIERVEVDFRKCYNFFQKLKKVISKLIKQDGL